MMTLTQLAHLGRAYSPRSEVMNTCFTNNLTSLGDASTGWLKKSFDLERINEVSVRKLSTHKREGT